MNIGITTLAYFTYELHLGLSNTVYLISKYLREKNAEVSIHTPLHKGQKTEEEFMGIKIRRFPFVKVLGEWTLSLDLLRALRFGGFDIIHSFYYGYYPTQAGFMAAKSAEIPYVMTPSYQNLQFSLVKTNLMNLYNKVLGRSLLKDSFCVFPQNIDELNKLRKVGDFAHKIVPCPINDDSFYPSDKKNDKMTILYMGPMGTWKGADVAIEICKEIEKAYDVRFLFIGAGPMEKELKSRGTKNFTFLKNLPQDVLGSYVRSCDVFLYPTKYDSFGRVIAEAMLSGIPVVSTRVGGVPETVGNGGFLVDYGDWDKMKEYTIRLLNDDHLRKKIGQKAVKHAQQFKTSAVADIIYRTYKEALNA